MVERSSWKMSTSAENDITILSMDENGNKRGGGEGGGLELECCYRLYYHQF
jgi:hypothetical protein